MYHTTRDLGPLQISLKKTIVIAETKYSVTKFETVLPLVCTGTELCTAIMHLSAHKRAGHTV